MHSQISDGNIDGLCTSVIGFIGKAVHMIDEEMPSSGKIKDLRYEADVGYLASIHSLY